MAGVIFSHDKISLNSTDKHALPIWSQFLVLLSWPTTPAPCLGIPYEIGLCMCEFYSLAFLNFNTTIGYPYLYHLTNLFISFHSLSQMFGHHDKQVILEVFVPRYR